MIPIPENRQAPAIQMLTLMTAGEARVKFQAAAGQKIDFRMAASHEQLDPLPGHFVVQTVHKVFCDDFRPQQTKVFFINTLQVS